MPHVEKKLHDFISLIDPAENQIFNMTNEEAEKRVASGDPSKVREIEGLVCHCSQVGTAGVSCAIYRPADALFYGKAGIGSAADCSRTD